MKRFLILLCLAGCAPLDGYPCETVDEQRCDGADVAFCETTSLGGKKWKTYDCPSGCDVAAAQKCSWKGVVEGAACPPSKNGVAVCSADGESTQCLTAFDQTKATWRTSACARCVKDKPIEEVLRKEGNIYRCD